MKKTLLKKGLVVGIIALFIGLAFIPSFNAESISMLENHPPYIPCNPYPDGPPVELDVILSWDGGDPDPEDTVTYFVYFDWPHNPPEVIGPYPANQTRIEYDPGELIYYKEYCWHVVAEDNHGLQTEGPIWSFTTIYPNQPPSKPSIDGPQTVSPGTYEWTFRATDPDGDNLTYEIQWGDYTSEKWIGPYASGENVKRSHIYTHYATVQIIARANDTHGLTGEWGTLLVHISKDKAISNLIFLRFLERYPLLNQLLELLNLK